MSKSVLIVEDNALVIEMYRSALRTLDVDVFEARNGQDALTLAAKHQPDLVLMDILLPGDSGYDVLKQMRASPGGGHPVVLAVTTAATKADAAKVANAGFNGLIPKPINIQNFIETVRRNLAG
ncbi:MAG TPA: two-component system response regulator [Alphaproteobacteria bacterium]|nr:two-component system response regulator [Alphaproteobacteria bacterium]